jgi:hypothetical protein
LQFIGHAPLVAARGLQFASIVTLTPRAYS